MKQSSFKFNRTYECPTCKFRIEGTGIHLLNQYLFDVAECQGCKSRTRYKFAAAISNFKLVRVPKKQPVTKS